MLEVTTLQHTLQHCVDYFPCYLGCNMGFLILYRRYTIVHGFCLFKLFLMGGKELNDKKYVHFTIYFLVCGPSGSQFGIFTMKFGDFCPTSF